MLAEASRIVARANRYPSDELLIGMEAYGFGWSVERILTT